MLVMGRADLVAHDGEELGLARFALSASMRACWAISVASTNCRAWRVALGDVAHDACEALLAVDIAPFGDRQFQRDDRAVLAQADHFAPNADDLAFAGVAKRGEIIVVPGVIGSGIRNSTLRSDRFLGG